MNTKKLFFILLLSLLFLSLSAVLFACGGEDVEDGETSLIGSWLSEDEGENFSRILYCFSENGHMLSVETLAGSTVSLLACHYTYANGTLTIAENGKETGDLSVVFDGDDAMTLALKEEDEKSMRFERVEKATLPYIGASYVYTDPFAEEGNATQYAFTDAMTVAVATYEAHVIVDYETYSYTYKDGVLTMVPLMLDSTQVTPLVFNAAFLYDGYMTLEPLDVQVGDGEVTPVYPLVRYVRES